jgi:hypothetical protein
MGQIHKNVAGARLRKLIDEALDNRKKHKKALPDSVVPPVWPAWPYVDGGNILGSTVSKEIGPPEKSQEELEWRLKQIKLVASARLATCVKLITAHIRYERFCDGHLHSNFESGHLTAILRRLTELAGARLGTTQGD